MKSLFALGIIFLTTASANILDKLIPPDQSANTIPTTYFNGLIVAKVFRSNETNEITNCYILNIERDVDKVVSLIRQNKILHLSILEMVSMIDECRKVTVKTSPSLLVSSEYLPSSVPSSVFELLHDLKRGFIPGTNWCGFGTRASNYFDLGVRGRVDSCCRAHDLCPYQVPPLRSRFGIDNMSLYTKSLCSCDDKFYHCLKESKSPLADIMGHVYFNVFQFRCLELTNEPKGPHKLFIKSNNRPFRKYKVTPNFNAAVKELTRKTIRY